MEAGLIMERQGDVFLKLDLERRISFAQLRVSHQGDMGKLKPAHAAALLPKISEQIAVGPLLIHFDPGVLPEEPCTLLLMRLHGLGYEPLIFRGTPKESEGCRLWHDCPAHQITKNQVWLYSTSFFEVPS